MFTTVWNFLTSTFSTLVETFENVFTYLQTTLHSVYDTLNLPTFLDNFLSPILNNWGQYTIAHLMLSTGVTLFIVVAIINFFNPFK